MVPMQLAMKLGMLVQHFILVKFIMEIRIMIIFTARLVLGLMSIIQTIILKSMEVFNGILR